MKKAIVRFGSLYVFNVVVLLLIGLLLRGVSVGWHAFWAAIILIIARVMGTSEAIQGRAGSEGD